jgi:hypothetical protein
MEVMPAGTVHSQEPTVSIEATTSPLDGIKEGEHALPTAFAPDTKARLVTGTVRTAQHTMASGNRVKGRRLMASPWYSFLRLKDRIGEQVRVHAKIKRGTLILQFLSLPSN